MLELEPVVNREFQRILNVCHTTETITTVKHFLANKSKLTLALVNNLSALHEYRVAKLRAA